MSEQGRDKEYLGDIREAMQRIVAYTADLSYEQFMNELKTQDVSSVILRLLEKRRKNCPVT